MKTAVPRPGSSCRSILMTALGAWLVVGSLATAQAPDLSKPTSVPAPAARVGITSLEQFLARALKTHPDIVAAEAEVELAQAKLTQTRFQIAHELITLWNDWQAQSEHVKHLQAELEVGRMGGAATMGQFYAARARVAEIESLLPYLLGEASARLPSMPAAVLPPGPKQVPAGPEVERILTALNRPAVLEFIECPIKDVADWLADSCQITFVVDPAVADLPVTLNMKDIPLGAALQAVEAGTPGVRFVVCDYGILVTSDTSAAASAFISANEFWKETGGKEGGFGPRPADFLRALRGRGGPGSRPPGGFGGRGGFPGGGKKKPPSDAGAPDPIDPPAPAPRKDK